MLHGRLHRLIACCALCALCVCPLSCGDPRPGDDPEERRNAMVDDIAARYEIDDPAVVDALRQTRRHLFVPENVRDMAYFDTPLPIGNDQTISAPSIVAVMTQLLEPKPDHVILEVGTGSGYQAAVLGRIVEHVYTIEIVTELAHSAKARLRRLGYDNISVRAGDGYRGWPDHAPFDGIIVTCAPERVPQPLVDQLAEGGRMVIPVGAEHDVQHLYLLLKQDGEIIPKSVLPVRFVPMTGEVTDQ